MYGIDIGRSDAEELSWRMFIVLFMMNKRMYTTQTQTQTQTDWGVVWRCVFVVNFNRLYILYCLCTWIRKVAEGKGMKKKTEDIMTEQWPLKGEAWSGNTYKSCST